MAAAPGSLTVPRGCFSFMRICLLRRPFFSYQQQAKKICFFLQ
nr:MAG TPA: hypothetical protein [Caudoviricetes sp.]